MLDQAQFKGLLIGGLNHIRSEWKQDEAQITKYQSPAPPSIEEIVDPLGSNKQLSQDEAEIKQRRVINTNQPNSESKRKRRPGQKKAWSR